MSRVYSPRKRVRTTGNRTTGNRTTNQPDIDYAAVAEAKATQQLHSMGFTALSRLAALPPGQKKNRANLEKALLDLMAIGIDYWDTPLIKQQFPQVYQACKQRWSGK